MGVSVDVDNSVLLVLRFLFEGVSGGGGGGGCSSGDAQKKGDASFAVSINEAQTRLASKMLDVRLHGLLVLIMGGVVGVTTVGIVAVNPAAGPTDEGGGGGGGGCPPPPGAGAEAKVGAIIDMMRRCSSNMCFVQTRRGVTSHASALICAR